MLHHRRGIATGYHVDPTNPTVRILDSYDSSKGIDTGVWARRIGRNYKKMENSSDIELSLRAHQEEDDSGISSPPLWKTSPPMTPTTRASTFQHHLPLSSRSQAIAKGRQEMMEMIQGMPESAYELSLKDLVELPLNKTVWQSSLVDMRDSTSETTQEERKTKMSTKKENDKRRNSRSSNVENGPFLLKMFFPAFLCTKKKSRGTSTCAKVSPKPQLVQVEGDKVAFEKRVDGDWWKKKFPVAEEDENSRGSRSSRTSSSNSGRSRHKGGLLYGCGSFFFTKKRRAGEHKGHRF